MGKICLFVFTLHTSTKLIYCLDIVICYVCWLQNKRIEFELKMYKYKIYGNRYGLA